MWAHLSVGRAKERTRREGEEMALGSARKQVLTFLDAVSDKGFRGGRQRLPVTQEIAGSNPVAPASYFFSRSRRRGSSGGRAGD